MKTMKRACLPLIYLFLISIGANAGVLFEEDFEDGNADGFTEILGYWTIAGGTYLCHTQGFEAYGMSLCGDSSWGDYHFECDLKVKGGINQIIRFRYQDWGNFYELTVRGDPYNDCYLYYVVNGTKIEMESRPLNNQPNTWHHIAIMLLGPEIVVVFDGVEIFQRSDLIHYLDGGIALTGCSGGVIQWQDASFDNVWVSDFVVGTENNTWGGVKLLFR